MFDLPAQRAPWTRSGIRLAAGQAYSLLAAGIIHWSERHRNLRGGPGFHLWARVHPGSRIVNVTRETGSFVADVDGELEFGVYLGTWLDEFGSLATPGVAYAKLRGAIEVLALIWRDDDRSRQGDRDVDGRSHAGLAGRGDDTALTIARRRGSPGGEHAQTSRPLWFPWRSSCYRYCAAGDGRRRRIA